MSNQDNAENRSRSDRSVRSDRSDRSNATGNPDPKRLRPSGGYRTLRSFQVATIIYDATVSFCDRFLDKRSRTVDQMVQAARSGRQNIAEGSRAASTSSQMELRLVNIARASLDELLLDYEDFLRQRGFGQWAKDDPQSQAVRDVGRRQVDRTDRSDLTDQTDQRYARWLECDNPAGVANTIICLIHQANYLLDRQIAGLERGFIQEGGYSEQLAAARIAERSRGKADKSDLSDLSDLSDPTNPTDRPSNPTCPLCGKPMIPHTARQGAHVGSQFWGCSGYPDCKGKRKSNGDQQ